MLRPMRRATAAEMLIRQLRDGLLLAGAAHAVWAKGSSRERYTYCKVDDFFWDPDASSQIASPLWQTGDIEFSKYFGEGYSSIRGTVTFYDVRFNPDHMARIVERTAKAISRLEEDEPKPAEFPASPTMVAEAQAELDAKLDKAAPASSRGRPRKDWWDDLWVEMARQLWVGDLKPSKLAEIETAMHDYLAQRNETASETPIRNAARKLFAMIQKEDLK